jgi:hypothetical protein
MNSSDLADWLQSLRLDIRGPGFLLESIGTWLANAPIGVVVTVAAIAVAAVAVARRPAAAALIVLGALGVLGVMGLSL